MNILVCLHDKLAVLLLGWVGELLWLHLQNPKLSDLVLFAICMDLLYGLGLGINDLLETAAGWRAVLPGSRNLEPFGPNLQATGSE